MSSIFAMFSPDGVGQVKNLSGPDVAQKRVLAIKEMQGQFEQYLKPKENKI